MTTVARPRAGAAIATVLGLVAVIVATVVGWNAGLLGAIVAPPPIVRAFLVGLAVAIGVTLLTRSIARMSASGEGVGGEPDVPGLIRAVRLVVGEGHEDVERVGIEGEPDVGRRGDGGGVGM